MRICKYFAAVFMALALAACSPLAIINAGVPNDTYRATTAIAYGSNARARLDVYQPVICSNGVVYSNGCYAAKACATNCVPYGGDVS